MQQLQHLNMFHVIVHKNNICYLRNSLIRCFACIRNVFFWEAQKIFCAPSYRLSVALWFMSVEIQLEHTLYLNFGADSC